MIQASYAVRQTDLYHQTIAQLETALQTLSSKGETAMQKNASVKSNGKDKHHKAGTFGIFKSKCRLLG